jgi:hypothetical protein
VTHDPDFAAALERENTDATPVPFTMRDERRTFMARRT